MLSIWISLSILLFGIGFTIKMLITSYIAYEDCTEHDQTSRFAVWKSFNPLPQNNDF